MLIDLRSDTVTKPSPEMLEAMFTAEVGDDVFDEDPSVKKLEEKTAAIFGKEAGLFCPSGTMTNQVAIRILTQSQQEIICDHLAHVYYYEGGGIAFNSGCSVRLLKGDRGRLNAKDIEENINPDNIHHPVTAVVTLENTSNKGGGSYYSLQNIKEIKEVCHRHQLKLHLDGARIFNALEETKDAPSETGKYFDTISVCLSKGLGAPVGSVLLSSKENIRKAKRVRKVFGGGMRQAGFLAAAGIYALDHNIERLKDDHKRAKIIGDEIKKLPFVEELFPVDTNIIVFKLSENVKSEDFLKKLAQKNIKAVSFGKQLIRMVTHLDFNDDMLDELVKTLGNYGN
ncbi:MAG TPA: GntG family PLP-dependent aldolase [Bacteroidia bacterium]|nr:GntG family PLP-dependent aldolase [Bacteroidia bacterium]